jgi:hypothetical protein
MFGVFMDYHSSNQVLVEIIVGSGKPIYPFRAEIIILDDANVSG